MTAEVDPHYRIDARALNYRDPVTHVSRLVQRPLHDIDGDSLADAYMRDYREAKQRGMIINQTLATAGRLRDRSQA